MQNSDEENGDVQPAEHLLALSLDTLEWEPHELLCLKAGKIRTVRDLVTKTESELLAIPGVSGGTLKAFRDFAERLGFKLEKGRFSQSGGRKTDTFSMPYAEYSLIELLIWRAWGIRQKKRGEKLYDWRPLYNRSEVLRAGLAALTRLTDDALHRAFEGLPVLRRGRPSVEEMQRLAELDELPTHRRAPQIDYIIDKFDFEALQRTMKDLDVKWTFSSEKRPRTPTVEELVRKSEELLELAIEDGFAEEVGLLAIRRLGVLYLMFAPHHQAGTLKVRVGDEAKK